MTIAEFHAALKAQGVKRHEDFAFRCPVCGTVQSAADLIEAGAGKTFDDVEQYVAFSCVGRWTGAGPFKKNGPRKFGCDWTLGGLFRIHALEVIDDNGEARPRFELASSDEAQAHAGRRALDEMALFRLQAERAHALARASLLRKQNAERFQITPQRIHQRSQTTLEMCEFCGGEKMVSTTRKTPSECYRCLAATAPRSDGE